MLSGISFVYFLFLANISFASVFYENSSPCCVDFSGVTKVRGHYETLYPDDKYAFRFSSGFYNEYLNFDSSIEGSYYNVEGVISPIAEEFSETKPLYIGDIDFIPYFLGEALSGNFGITLSHLSTEEIFFGVAKSDATKSDWLTSSAILIEGKNFGYFKAIEGFNYYAVVYGDVSTETVYRLGITSVPLPGALLLFASIIIPFGFFSGKRRQPNKSFKRL